MYKPSTSKPYSFHSQSQSSDYEFSSLPDYRPSTSEPSSASVYEYEHLPVYKLATSYSSNQYNNPDYNSAKSPVNKFASLPVYGPSTSKPKPVSDQSSSSVYEYAPLPESSESYKPLVYDYGSISVYDPVNLIHIISKPKKASVPVYKTVTSKTPQTLVQEYDPLPVYKPEIATSDHYSAFKPSSTSSSLTLSKPSSYKTENSPEKYASESAASEYLSPHAETVYTGKFSPVPVYYPKKSPLSVYKPSKDTNQNSPATHKTVIPSYAVINSTKALIDTEYTKKIVPSSTYSFFQTTKAPSYFVYKPTDILSYPVYKTEEDNSNGAYKITEASTYQTTKGQSYEANKPDVPKYSWFKNGVEPSNVAYKSAETPSLTIIKPTPAPSYSVYKTTKGSSYKPYKQTKTNNVVYKHTNFPNYSVHKTTKKPSYVSYKATKATTHTVYKTTRAPFHPITEVPHQATNYKSINPSVFAVHKPQSHVDPLVYKPSELQTYSSQQYRRPKNFVSGTKKPTGFLAQLFKLPKFIVYGGWNPVKTRK